MPDLVQQVVQAEGDGAAEGDGVGRRDDDAQVRQRCEDGVRVAPAGALPALHTAMPRLQCVPDLSR